MPNRISAIYQKLFDHFGPQHWWPADSPLEVMVGAVLTQNTNWINVNRAINNLRDQHLLSIDSLSSIPEEHLAALIRPAGYYNLKAKRLRNLLELILQDFEGSLATFFNQPLDTLRAKLLAVKGIGPETADSILLYAGEKPVFVVDAYTHRILYRHHLVPEDATYHEIQTRFTDALPSDTLLFNEYHALLVQAGKKFCKKTSPRCESCPLQNI